MVWNPYALKSIAFKLEQEFPDKLKKEARELFSGAVQDISGIHGKLSDQADRNLDFLRTQRKCKYSPNIVSIARKRASVESKISYLQLDLQERIGEMSSFYEEMIGYCKELYSQLASIAGFVQESRFGVKEGQELLDSFNSNPFGQSIFPVIFLGKTHAEMQERGIITPAEFSEIIDYASHYNL